MLGLRPRLKARPSFLDLVRTQSIEKLSVQPPALSVPDSRTDDDRRLSPLNVALPASPTKEETNLEDTESASVQKPKTHARKMAPVSTCQCRGSSIDSLTQAQKNQKRATDEDGEEQYGQCAVLM